jgi:hypothetical protein
MGTPEAWTLVTHPQLPVMDIAAPLPASSPALAFNRS